MKECINCGNVCDTPYCPVCGQKMEVTRVSLKGITSEFFSKWMGFDTQFGRTVIDMAVRPGEVILSYLHGNRTKYIGPLGFLVVMTALILISFDAFGLTVQDFLDQNQSNFNDAIGQEASEQQVKFQKVVSEFIAKYYRFFSAIMIPFWAISFWFFYRSAKLNYIERLVAAIYMSSEGMWITILMLGIFALTGKLFNLEALILSSFFYAYCLHRTFPSANFFISFLKGVGSILVAFVLVMLIGGVIMIGIGIVLAATNPEMFNQQG